MEICVVGDYINDNFEVKRISTNEIDKKIICSGYYKKNIFSFQVPTLNDFYYVLVKLKINRFLSKPISITIEKPDYNKQKFKLYKMDVFNKKCCSCDNKALQQKCEMCSIHHCINEETFYVCKSCMNECPECGIIRCKKCKE